MSWIDRVQNKLRITTPDNKVYEVLWMNATKSIEWHGSEFSFINVQDQFVKKEKLLGRKFPLEFYFTGENHLEEAGLFEISLNDKRPCLIEHPYYNTIVAQILQVNFDNTQLNVTKVTATAIETITENNPRTSIDPVDAIIIKKQEIDQACEEELTEEPTITDVNNLNIVNSQNYNTAIKIVTVPEEAQEYFNAFNEASTLVNNITASPILAMRATIALVTLPAKFTASVQDRVSTLVETFVNLRRTLSGLFMVSSKQIYQSQGIAIISSMCQAAVTPLDGNYTNSISALIIIDDILNSYNQLIEDLDSVQGQNGSSPDNFVQDPVALSTLADAVNITVSNLISIALNGKQERSVVLTEDSNIITLTHRFYGGKNIDSNINEFVNNNNLTYRDILGIPKGRTVVYYK